uniref:Lipase_GDSL domain-containing protein n=1 Tax=Strongyloides venezuelensis TaxID=75913 RepID=A0A0K0G309_STRVS
MNLYVKEGSKRSFDGVKLINLYLLLFFLSILILVDFSNAISTSSSSSIIDGNEEHKGFIHLDKLIIDDKDPDKYKSLILEREETETLEPSIVVEDKNNEDDYTSKEGDSDVSEEIDKNALFDHGYLKAVNIDKLEEQWGANERPKGNNGGFVATISEVFNDRKSFACPKVKERFITGTSVENISPEDIGIIASLGDNLATGYGLWPGSSIDFRGASFSSGGDTSIDGLVTIPSIIQEFSNKDIIGVSHGLGSKDQLPKSQLNLAQVNTNSGDLPKQAHELIGRLKLIKDVDTYNTWTMVIITIGTDEVCNFCRGPNTDALIEAIDILNRGIHKALIIMLGPVHVTSRTSLRKNLLKDRCNCSQDKNDEFMKKLSNAWIEGFQEVEGRVHAYRRSTFTLLQLPIFTITSRYPFSLFIKNSTNLNRRGHNYAAKWLWNRLVTGPSYNITQVLSQDSYYCPDSYCPFFRVPENFGKCVAVRKEDYEKNPELFEKSLHKGKNKKHKSEIYKRTGIIILVAATAVTTLSIIFYNKHKQINRRNIAKKGDSTRRSEEDDDSKALNNGESPNDYLLLKNQEKV